MQEEFDTPEWLDESIEENRINPHKENCVDYDSCDLDDDECLSCGS